MARGARPTHGGAKTYMEKRVANRTEENLDPAARAVRDAFVREYLRDFNGKRAMLRTGLTTEKTAACKASQMMREPYVQRRIALEMQRIEEEGIVTRAEVLWGLKREAYFDDPVLSSHAARVAAWSKLAKLLGMEIDQLKIDAVFRGGVMVVPMPQSVDQWEQAAISAQKQLKGEVRE